MQDTISKESESNSLTKEGQPPMGQLQDQPSVNLTNKRIWSTSEDLDLI